jgi:hypothetical protein
VQNWPVTNLDEQSQARAPRERRPDPSRGPQQGSPRGERPQRDRGSESRPPRGNDRDSRDGHGEPATGFADNVPAFLRKTTRNKVAND